MIVFFGWTADYDRLMINELSKKINVKAINFPEGRFFFRINKVFGYKIIRFFLKICSFGISDASLLVFKDSDGYGYHKNLDLFKQKKILLIRNIIYKDSVCFFRDNFDEIYSFDQLQAKKNNFKLMSQIFPLISVPYDTNIKYNSCYFVGLDKHRAQTLNVIGDVIHSKYGIECDFNIVKDKTSSSVSPYYISKGLSYADNLKKTQECTFILEINQQGQSGLTLRTLEAMFFSKKLISNNPHLKKFDFYDEGRIYVFESVEDFNSNEFTKFIEAPFLKIEEHMLNKYKALTFFESLV